MPIGSIKDLKIFCFIVTYFITSFLILYPIEKQVWNLFTSTIHLHILYTVTEFKENRQRNPIYMEEYATVHGLLSWFFVLLNLYCSNKYSSIIYTSYKTSYKCIFFFSIPS